MLSAIPSIRIQKNWRFIRLEDVIYMKMKNDLAFLIDDVLNLWEHQSTWNPNMPVRGAFYIVEEYRKYIEQEGAEPVWKPSDYASRSSILCILQWLEGRAGQCRAEVINRIFHAYPELEPCMEFKAVMVNINRGT